MRSRSLFFGRALALEAVIYRLQLEALDDESLRELQRLLSDLDYEKQMAVQQARLQPWRR